MIHKGVDNSTPTVVNKNNLIYNQINYMSGIPFKINKDVLDFLLEKGVSMNLILGSLHKETELFKNLSPSQKKEVLSHNSLYFLQKNILEISVLFKDMEKFYFPLFFD
jgi:hypothetical protein